MIPMEDYLVEEFIKLMDECERHKIIYYRVNEAAASLWSLRNKKSKWSCGREETKPEVDPNWKVLNA